MRKELNDMELDAVTGGTVNLSEELGMVQFTSMGRTFMLNKNVPFKEIRNCMLDLYDDNKHLSDAEFDRLVAKTFRAKGYI